MEQAVFDFELSLSEEERAVYRLLRPGRARAVSSGYISERTGLSDRAVRQTIRSLIMDRGILVATAVHEPTGFFIAVDPEEIIDATRSLRHRGIMILARAARLQQSSLELVFNQGKLELEGKGERAA